MSSVRSDSDLIQQFYAELCDRFPDSDITREIADCPELIHIVMSAVQRHVEGLCTQRMIAEASECFRAFEPFFVRSQNELRNAFNVSFLENFIFWKGLSEQEFRSALPKELYDGYVRQMDYWNALQQSMRDESQK